MEDPEGLFRFVSLTILMQLWMRLIFSFLLYCYLFFFFPLSKIWFLNRVHAIIPAFLRGENGALEIFSLEFEVNDEHLREHGQSPGLKRRVMQS